MIKVETFTGNPLTSYDEIQCLDISFRVIAWMFIYQSNNAITGLNLQSKNKTPNFQCFPLTLSSWMILALWNLGSRLQLVLGYVIFPWETWYLFSDDMQVMINHHLLLKFLKGYLQEVLWIHCYLGFADGDAISAKMSLSKGHLWMAIHSKYCLGKLRITWYTWLS